MKVKTIMLEHDTLDNVRSLCASDDTLLVVRPENKIVELCKSAIHKRLYQKVNVDAEYDAIRAYFAAMCQDEGYLQELDRTIDEVAHYLTQGMTIRMDYDSLINLVMSKFTALCARAVAAVCGCAFVDGTDLIVCDDESGVTSVNWDKTAELMHQHCDGMKCGAVSGGYGRSPLGYCLEIGRGGTELMASAMAYILKAECVEYYAHRNGIQGLRSMSYQEAALFLSSDEANEVHALALWYASKAGIDMYVKDIRNVALPGTCITASPVTHEDGVVTGVTSNCGLSLITIYGIGLMGSIGISSAIFGAISQKGINIRFISQSSVEYSISLAVSQANSSQAMEAIRELLAQPRYVAFRDVLCIDQQVGIVSVCGNRMRKVPGISGKVFSALGNEGISIIAASQGGEEMSISIVVSESEAERAVQAIRKAVMP